ncbi:MAG: hypothetical protein WCG93_11190 [Paludibacter sp.]
MKFKFYIIIFIVLFCQSITFASQKVYVIHGFAGFPLQMEKIVQGLNHSGFLTENYTYPSFSEDLDSVGRDLYRKVKYENFDTVSFVTHSMGGLVVRSMYQYLDSTVHFPFIYRVVMLAPPNKGTELADFQFNHVSKTLLGPNVENMKTNYDSYVNKLPFPTSEVGVIAGIRGKKPWFNPFLKEDNDGTVTIGSAIMGGEKDVAIIKSMHILMPEKEKVIQLVITFMKTGCFIKNKNIK